jgi:hypothetical protein
MKLFGYRIEPDFNIAREQRRDRLNWPLYGGLVLCIAYLFTGWPYATEIFQGWVATSLFYGEVFYVRQRGAFRKLWLWKALFATLPFHFLYLASIFWSDLAFPHVMTKAIVFIPVLAVGFAMESILTQKIIARFRPSADGTRGPDAK